MFWVLFKLWKQVKIAIIANLKHVQIFYLLTIGLDLTCFL